MSTMHHRRHKFYQPENSQGIISRNLVPDLYRDKLEANLTRVAHHRQIASLDNKLPLQFCGDYVGDF